jgi:two-component system NtrC family sensor kinase
MRLLKEKGSLSHHEVRVITATGKLKTVLTSMKLYPEQEYLEGTSIDITELKHAEEAARQAQQQLRMSERLASLGTFAAGVAHEVNNPVGAMVLAAETALEHLSESSPDGPVAELLADVVRNGQHCSLVTRSMLQFARQQPTEKWPFDLRDVLERAVASIRRSPDALGADISVQWDERIPTFVANPIVVQQVFANLLRNAAQAESTKIRLAAVADPNSRSIRVIVEDNGRGIAPEHLPRLFDPFFTTRQSHGGTGLGLSIVHGIITDHGGAISVESTPGKGTRMTLRLPLGKHRP